MRHLKKFNENKHSVDLDIFKEIIYSVTDDIGFDVEFHYWEGTEARPYEEIINADIKLGDNMFNYETLPTYDHLNAALPYIDEPEPLQGLDTKSIIGVSNDKITDLQNFKNKLDERINSEKKIQELMEKLPQIEERLSQFEGESRIGFESYSNKIIISVLIDK